MKLKSEDVLNDLEIFMSKNGWIKHFADGTVELGHDHLVRARKASWTNGRINDLVAVEIRHGEMNISLYGGLGNWWQSDTMIARYGKNRDGSKHVSQPTFLTRRIEYQISQDDVGKLMGIWVYKNSLSTVVRLGNKKTIKHAHVIRNITEEHVGMWIIAAIQVQEMNFKIHFSDNKQ